MSFQESWTVDLAIPQGTIQRIIGTVGYRTDQTQAVGNFGYEWWYALNVGAAATSAVLPGLDDPDVMMRRAVLPFAQAADDRVQEPRTLERWDLEGQRIVGSGETLWFTVASAQAGVGWLWSISVRVLLLLP